MPASLLFTQCLQNDFVQPIGRYDPIPNRLHVGYAEALRLMGENPAEGPVARTMRWAYVRPEPELAIVHIRDGHDDADPHQREHLERFGKHCLCGTPGAAFAFAVPSGPRSVAVVDSPSLNDFADTSLARVLEPWSGKACRAGIIGVWTEAKVAFLAYELKTRYPLFDVAVCSALTASSSRQRHFEALDQMARILGVRVFDAVGEFLDFLGGDAPDAPLIGLPAEHPQVEASGVRLTDDDRTLVRYLFRDCRRVDLKALDGGFSGNVVASARSVDLRGHDEVPHVLKIGPRVLMGKERSSFERIQHVLGNNAPQIADFADLGERGAIKYRYASMGGTITTTFQKAYGRGIPLDQVHRVLDTVFGEQLMRFYKAATLESGDLLEHYGFSTRWAGNVRARVEAVLGAPASGPTVEVLPGRASPNPCEFYETTLANLPRRAADPFHQAYVHGDLNGANIILDAHGNVWLIDFFHTRRAHVLMDLIKLENDLLYIFTPLADDDALRRACDFTDALLEVADLAAPPSRPCPVAGEPFVRAWETVRLLRGFHPGLVHSNRDPFQLWVGQLRYAVHTLSFDESDARQKRWALYAAGRLAERIVAALRRAQELRLDWLDERWTRPGRLALTLLPGRKDVRRDLSADLAAIEREGVRRVLMLVTDEELEGYGVEGLPAAYAARGIALRRLPILDQKACPPDAMHAALDWVEAGLAAGERVLMHCVGGLGRSGMAAGALLRRRGASAEVAITEVRRARSPRAVETPVQERFVREFGAR